MDQNQQNILQSLSFLDPNSMMENRGIFTHPQGQYPYPFPYPQNASQTSSSLSDVTRPSQSIITPPHQIFQSSQNLVVPQGSLSNYQSSFFDSPSFPNELLEESGKRLMAKEVRPMPIAQRTKFPVDTYIGDNLESTNSTKQPGIARMKNPISQSQDNWESTHIDEKKLIRSKDPNLATFEIQRVTKDSKVAENSPTTSQGQDNVDLGLECTPIQMPIQHPSASNTLYDQATSKTRMTNPSPGDHANMFESKLHEQVERQHDCDESSNDHKKSVPNARDMSLKIEKATKDDEKHVPDNDVDGIDGDVDSDSSSPPKSPSQYIEFNEVAQGVFKNINSIAGPAKPFQCDECVASYTNKNNLKAHKKIHSGIESFVCEFCQRAFSGRHPLERHRRQHTGEKPFKCNQCGESFISREGLVGHTRHQHTKERPYKCNQCDAAFAFNARLIRHSKIHTGEKPYKCEHCSMTFAYKSTCIKHQLKHSDDALKCEKCRLVFNDPFKFAEHIKNHDNPSVVSAEGSTNSSAIESWNYNCEFCDKNFKTKRDFTVHRRIHTGEKPFACETCDASFIKRSYLKIHMRKHTGERPYKCDECDAAFMESTGLRSHRRSHTGEKPFKCEICETRFTQKPALVAHFRIHTGEKPFKCDACELSFRQKSTLTIHKRQHTGEKPYKCEECESFFAQSSQLTLHKKRIHTGNKPYPCKECNASFNKEGSLIAHKLKHSGGIRLESDTPIDEVGENTLQCMECEKVLPNKSSFKAHMKKHKGKKTFVCDDCGATFTHSSRLATHRRKHTGEKPYKCVECDAAFTMKSYLTLHFRKHSSERPFKCEECDATFTKRMLLTAHHRIHTGECPYKCKVCGEAFRVKAHLSRHKKTHTKERSKSSNKQTRKRQRGIEPEKLLVTSDVDSVFIKQEPTDSISMSDDENNSYLHINPVVQIKIEGEDDNFQDTLNNESDPLL